MPPAAQAGRRRRCSAGRTPCVGALGGAAGRPTRRVLVGEGVAGGRDRRPLRRERVSEVLRMLGSSGMTQPTAGSRVFSQGLRLEGQRSRIVWGLHTARDRMPAGLTMTRDNTREQLVAGRRVGKGWRAHLLPKGGRRVDRLARRHEPGEGADHGAGHSARIEATIAEV